VAPVAPGKKGLRRQLGSLDPPVEQQKPTGLRHERRASGNIMVDSLLKSKNCSNEQLKESAVVLNNVRPSRLTKPDNKNSSRVP
jgi:hypothetical protein